jgi:hypothetical protein
MPVDPAPAPDSAFTFDTPSQVVVRPARRRRPPPGGFPWRFVVLGLVLAVAAALTAWGAVWMRYALRSEEEGQGARTAALREFNCEFQIPGPPWKPDDRARRDLQVNLALSRDKPADHLGLFVRDYRTRMPREGELTDEALARLRAYFPALEWQWKPADKARLGGQPARVLEFVGTDGGQQTHAGECCVMAYRGFAYWLFTWGPEDDKDALAAEWARLRAGFRLLDARESWKEKPRATESAEGTRATFRLAFPADLWKKVEPKEFDPRADLVLEAYEPEPGGKPYAAKSAHFLALVLPRATDLPAAVAAARAHLARRLEEEGHKKARMDVVKEKGGGEADRDADLGTLHGRLLKLHVTDEDSSSSERFVLLAVVLRPQGVLALVGDCDWNRRDFWEQEFVPLLDSLKGR